MSFETLKIQLRELCSEIKRENFYSYYEKFAHLIREYRANGGKGKVVHDYLVELAKEYSEEVFIEEVLVDTLNRLVAFCRPSRYLLFEDFDLEKNSWRDTPDS